MVEANEWAGRVGAEWAKQADGLDFLLGPMGEVGIEALGRLEGTSVLDLGCGAGQSSLKIAASGADVLGVDISPDLVARARARAEAVGSDAQFMLADAGEATFERQFDRLFSRFGCMFFSAPEPSFANLHKAIKPGGEAALVAWTEPRANPWIAVPVKVARTLWGADAIPPAQPGAPGPFAWDKLESFEPMLGRAGWRDIHVESFERELILSAGDADDPIERAVHFCTRIGPLARKFKELDEPQKAELPEKLAEALAPFLRDGAVRVPGKAWLIRMVA